MPGQFYFVPGGTIHAIGAGVTLVEIQQNSDTTYRLYDWGRMGSDGRPRETNVEQALHAVRPTNAARKPRRPYRKGTPHKDDENKRGACVDAQEFAVDLLELCDPLETRTEDLAVVYVVLEGGGRIARADGRGSWSLAVGETWLVPACLGDHRIEPEGTLRVLHVRTKA